MGFWDSLKLVVRSNDIIAVLFAFSFLLIVAGFLTNHKYSEICVLLGFLGFISGIGLATAQVVSKNNQKEEVKPISDPLIRTLIRVLVAGIMLPVVLFAEYTAIQTLAKDAPSFLQIIFWAIGLMVGIIEFYVVIKNRRWILEPEGENIIPNSKK
jgi:c-di-AMP phosphodiesterase-like protein